MRRTLLSVAARVLTPAAFARLHCAAKLGYRPNLDNPTTFTERLLAKRVFDHDPLIPLTADKFTLRGYVEERLGEGYLPRLYAVIESVADVDLTSLPADYVMKGTHGSGWNRIVTGSDLTRAEAMTLATDWLGRSYYRKRLEWAYRDLTPRVVFEENLAPGRPIDDYKVFVFGGVPRIIQVDRDRFTDHRRTLYTPEWRAVSVACEYPLLAAPVEVPPRLGEMLGAAAKLAEPFAFARVDFYSLPDRLVVGEITHYPEGGVVRFEPRAFDLELGAVWGGGRPVGGEFLTS